MSGALWWACSKPVLVRHHLLRLFHRVTTLPSRSASLHAWSWFELSDSKNSKAAAAHELALHTKLQS